MAKIKNTENWEFETKQLHIGQEIGEGAVQGVLHGQLIQNFDAHGLVEGGLGGLAGHAGLGAVVDVHQQVIVVIQAGDDAADGAEAAGGVVGLCHIAEAADKVICGDLVFGLGAGVVHPVQVGLQLKGPDAEVIIVLPAFSQAGDRTAVAVGLHQTLHQVGNKVIIRGCLGGIGVHGGDGGGEGGFVLFQVSCVGIGLARNHLAATGGR